MPYFDRFAVDDVMEIRCIRQGEVQRFWSMPSGYAKLERELHRLNQQGFDIYCGVNPRIVKTSEVARVVALHVDVDEWKGITDKNPQPSLSVSSGGRGGRHFYWHIIDADVTKVKGINRGLALALGGDTHCSDAARILRIPGFVNNKVPVRLVTVLEDSGIVYPFDDFLSFYRPCRSNGCGGVEVERTGTLSFALSLRFDHFIKTDRSGDAERAWHGEVGDGSSDSRWLLVQKMRPHFTLTEVMDILCSREWQNRRTGLVKGGDEVERDVALLLSKAAE